MPTTTDEPTAAKPADLHRQLVAVEVTLSDIEEVMCDVRHDITLNDDVLDVLDDLSVSLGVLRDVAESVASGFGEELRRLGLS